MGNHVSDAAAVKLPVESKEVQPEDRPAVWGLGFSNQKLIFGTKRISYEKGIDSKLSGDEVYCTNYVILLAKSISCSELHFQKFLI